MNKSKLHGGRRGDGSHAEHLNTIPQFSLSKLAIKNLSRKGEMAGLCVVHVKLPPHYTHAPIVHRRTEEWLIILNGRGYGTIGSRKINFRPGTIVYMPPGVPHRMSSGSGPIEILAVFSPALDARKKDADIHVVTESAGSPAPRGACFASKGAG